MHLSVRACVLTPLIHPPTLPAIYVHLQFPWIHYKPAPRLKNSVSNVNLELSPLFVQVSAKNGRTRIKQISYQLLP